MDNLLIALGLVLVILFLLAPTLIATLTGRKVQVRTKTGSFASEPFKTKKKRKKEEEQDKIVKELNQFCQEVAFAELPKNDAVDMWTFDMGFEFPNLSGRPILTNRAVVIANKGNISKALIGYRNLQNQKKLGRLDDVEYKFKILELYKELS